MGSLVAQQGPNGASPTGSEQTEDLPTIPTEVFQDPNVRLSQLGTPGDRSYLRSLNLSWFNNLCRNLAGLMDEKAEMLHSWKIYTQTRPMGLPYMLISWGGLGVNVGIYGIHGVFGICSITSGLPQSQESKPRRRCF